MSIVSIKIIYKALEKGPGIKLNSTKVFAFIIIKYGYDSKIVR